ncbi:ring-infected erythrocyte surface antigen-like [Helianthus annuus]|uniref:ring-infected erythrocyte surface antigen-like n=1 Tax=Helianthus annuus TaxID=4232 RepID=UPI000B8FFDD3|nr:ring-infected erythrocyte surface antigen-like [Helianthus annuus]
MEKEKKDAEETAEALKDKGKGVVVDKEEIFGSSSQQVQQPDAENVEANVAEVEANVEDVEVKITDVEVFNADVNVEVNVAEVEVNEENALVLAQLFTLVGEPKTVSYSREDNMRRIEVERHRLRAKPRKYEMVDEDDDDDDEELKEWFGEVDDYHYDGKDDDNDDDDQGGNGGAMIVRRPGGNQVNDYLDDTQNEER